MNAAAGRTSRTTPTMLSRGASRSQADPAERWEIDCGAAPDPFGRGIYEVFPHSPRRAEDLPEGALEALNDRCALENLAQLFVISRALRSTGPAGRQVISPRSVLGIGARAVGLWTEEPEQGLKVLIPLDMIGAIEDVTILLYGRLTFVSFDERLTIRYNTLGRSILRRALIALRERLAGPALPLPVTQRAAEARELPIKWKRVLRSAAVRLREDAPVVSAFAVDPGMAGEEIDRGQLLVVNPHELVLMQDPPEASHNYGEDAVVIPRARITRARVREGRLEIASCGARLSLSMAPDLLRAAARWLAAP